MTSLEQTLPDPLILVSPEVMSGAAVFNGTRVPVKALFDYIEGGDALDEFLDDFPDVSREHAVGVLRLADQSMIGPATILAERPRHVPLHDVTFVHSHIKNVP